MITDAERQPRIVRAGVPDYRTQCDHEDPTAEASIVQHGNNDA